MDDNVLLLSKPRKKGLIRLVFSRFFVILLLLALQVMLIVSIYVWLSELLPWFVGVLMLFTIGGVIYLFSCGMDS